MSKAYVLLSGGIDSTTCLSLAWYEHDQDVTALCLNYGQRHTKELIHAEAVAKHFSVPFRIIDIDQVIGMGGLTDENLEIPKVSYEELGEGISPTYVPFRNGLLLSIAASIAMADRDAVAIYYGAHAEDAENDAYPDCSVPFIDAIGRAIWIGTYEQIRLETPLAFWTKAQVITVGKAKGTPYGLTWSCYEGGENHCGVCPTCRARIEAFTLAHVPDPTVYDNGVVSYKGEPNE